MEISFLTHITRTCRGYFLMIIVKVKNKLKLLSSNQIFVYILKPVSLQGC